MAASPNDLAIRDAEGPTPRGRRHLLLQWHITERCNLRCAHCYQEKYAGGELGLQDLLRILGEFKALLGTRRGHITVTGGEPFVRPDFLDLVGAFASERGRYGFGILTNGTLIDEDVARRLRDLRPTFVQVSLDGARETHDRIRGPGAYDRAVAGASHLTREGVRTFLSFTAHRGNFREFAHVVREGERLGVSRVWADRLIPCGAGASLAGEMLSPQETRELFEMMRAERSRSSRTEVAMHRALQFLVGGGVPYRCAAGDSLITIQPNGDLLPCRRMPIRVGNVLETSLMEMYERDDCLRALRDMGRVPDRCRGCGHAQWCGGGLRCLSYAVTGDPFQADPGCWVAMLDRSAADR